MLVAAGLVAAGLVAMSGVVLSAVVSVSSCCCTFNSVVVAVT